MELKERLIQLVKSTPVLYKLWFITYRKRKGVRIKMLKAGMSLYLDGFPRSGNTFAVHLIKTAFPGIRFAHHFHTIAPIKMALRMDIPVIVLLRDPENAICSLYLKHLAMTGKDYHKNHINKDYLSRFCLDYATYYSWVRNNSNQLQVVEFADLIKDPEAFLVRVNEVIKPDLRISKLQIQKSVVNASQKKFGSQDLLGGSLPNELKDQAKKEISQVLNSIPGFYKCKHEFSSLIDG